MAVVGHEDTSKTTLYVSPIHLLVPYPCLGYTPHSGKGACSPKLPREPSVV